MDTPITIVSSSSSSLNKPSKKSDTSIARVPVSWNSPLKPHDRDTSCTPSTLQKVNSWINSLQRLKRSNVDDDSRKSSIDFNEFENELGMDGDFLHGMIGSSDFSKSEVKEDKMLEDELSHYYNSPSYELYKKKKGFYTNEPIFGGGSKSNLYPKEHKRYQTSKVKNSKSDDSDSDVPLSPESEKKKELCSYLQLMKPTDKKTVMTLQNRRSTRVKNLSIMQEKRELDKKLREEQSDNDNTDPRVPQSQSFDENNLEEQYWLRSFSFPKPKNDLREVILDFDAATKEDWFEDWKKQQEKLSIHKKNNSLQSETPDIREKNKFTIKRLGDPSRGNADNAKKVKVNKNEEKHLDDQKAMESIKKSKSPKMVNGFCSKQDKNGLTEKSFFMPKPSIHLTKGINDFDGDFRKVGISENSLESDSECIQFSIPKPAEHLVRGIRDFADIIRNDLNSTSVLPIKRVNNVSDISKLSPVMNNKKAPLHNADIDKDLISETLLSVSKEADTESKLSSPVKTKDSKIRKKKKLKKNKLIKSSSFKIKLITRKKSLCKNKDKKSERLSTDSLPNKTKDSPSTKLDVKKRIKKENLKEKLDNKKTGKEKDAIPKSPLKDTNENPSLQNEASKSILNMEQKASEKTLPVATHSPKSQCEQLASNRINEKQPSKNISALKDKLVINTRRNKLLPIKKLEKKHTFTERRLERGKSAPPAMKRLRSKESTEKSIEHKEKSPLTIENKQQSRVAMPKRDLSPPSQILAIFKYESKSISNLEPNKIPLESFHEKEKKKGEFISEILNIEVSSNSNSEDDMLSSNGGIGESSDNSEFNKTSRQSPKSTSVNKASSSPISSKGLAHVEATPFISFKKDSLISPLHRCLNYSKKKGVITESGSNNWPTSSPTHRQKKDQHSIHISWEDGPVLKIFYMEYNLVLCQESLVSLWTQTALGNVLGAQNMWVSKGCVRRLSMNNNCVFKGAQEMVVSTDSSVAYIELWTKEHQSEIRESPVADVFAIVYFWKKGHNGLDKKVLQLENIKGFADDVQYSILKSSSKIVVSWHLASNEIESKSTFVHCYQLDPDFQSVCNISEFEAVEHYVSSLHNIEGCDTLIMGCGENKITLWNIEHGYVAATIGMLDIKSPLSTLWVKCDRGFLFTLQECVDRELRLIVINGMNHLWKKLASYVPPQDYDRLKGVCVENGMVIAFYDQGIICWNAQTAEVVLEACQNEAEYISGKYIISLTNDQLKLRHAITYLLSSEVV